MTANISLLPHRTHITGLVDFQIYCDMLATRIGCNPPLIELFFKKPSIWLKIMFGPFTMHQYRY